MMQDDKGVLAWGPYDVLIVLRNKCTQRFHAAVLVEAEMITGTPKFVRLRSKFHYSVGAAKIDLARQQLAGLVDRFHPPANNIATEPFPWDGDWPFYVITGNWVAAGVNVSEMIHHPR